MEQDGQALTSLQSLNLDLPPSCIEFCPAHSDYFVVGTYNLQKDENSAEGDESPQDEDKEKQVNSKRSQSRNGSLLVFQLKGNELCHVQTTLQPSAILDLHFHPCPGKQDILAVVSSTGTLSFFKLTPLGDSSSTLVELSTQRPLGDEGDILFLSCCWHEKLPSLIALTTSTYEVYMFQVNENWNLADTNQRPILTHTLEAWTVAISPFLSEFAEDTEAAEKKWWTQEFTIYSGGDDSNFLHTTCHQQSRIDGEEQRFENPYPTLRSRGHGAGVTAILPLEIHLSDDSVVVVTGSYDDHIRLYAVHEQGQGKMGRQSRLLHEKNLGGGVWRLKLVKIEKDDAGSWTNLILASCMHAGSRVLRVAGDLEGNCKMQILARFEEHKSMNYGSDFQPGSQQTGETLRCVSTSFYDKLLCLWELPAGPVTE